MRRYAIALTIIMLAACTEQGRPPAINSGSYDWGDAYYGTNGYHLPGWTVASPK